MAIIIPVMLLILGAIIQYTMYVATQMMVNYAGYRAVRAVYISANKEGPPHHNQRSISEDIRSEVREVMVLISNPINVPNPFILSWLYPFYSYEVDIRFFNQGNEFPNEGQELSEDMPINSSQYVWITITAHLKIIMPFVAPIFNGWNFLKPWIDVKSTFLATGPTARDGDEIRPPEDAPFLMPLLKIILKLIQY